MLTSVLPWKIRGSWLGPVEYANVQTAWADLSSYAKRRLFKPSRPMAVKNHLLLCRVRRSVYLSTWEELMFPYIYGPGNSLNALKHKAVSSTRTGPLICATVIQWNGDSRRVLLDAQQ